MATVTSKGQITIPKEVRDDLHLRPGDRVEFRRDAGGTFVLRPVRRSILDLAGMLRYRGRPVPVEEMDAAIRKAAADRDRETRP